MHREHRYGRGFDTAGDPRLDARRAPAEAQRTFESDHANAKESSAVALQRDREAMAGRVAGVEEDRRDRERDEPRALVK